MKHQYLLDNSRSWPNAWTGKDSFSIDLSDESTAFELFVPNPNDRFYHIFRFMLETVEAGRRICTEGILLGQTSSPVRPDVKDWNGNSDTLQIMRYINLGIASYDAQCTSEFATPISGQINDDPIIFLNFDPASTKTKYLTDLSFVPVQVREAHHRFLQEHAKVV